MLWSLAAQALGAPRHSSSELGLSACPALLSVDLCNWRYALIVPVLSDGHSTFLLMLAATLAVGVAPTLNLVFQLRDRYGRPTMFVRVLAAAVIAGLVVLTAPLFVIPLLEALF